MEGQDKCSSPAIHSPFTFFCLQNQFKQEICMQFNIFVFLWKKTGDLIFVFLWKKREICMQITSANIWLYFGLIIFLKLLSSGLSRAAKLLLLGFFFDTLGISLSSNIMSVKHLGLKLLYLKSFIKIFGCPT